MDSLVEANNTADYLGLEGEDRDLFIDKPHQFVKYLQTKLLATQRIADQMEAQSSEYRRVLKAVAAQSCSGGAHCSDGYGDAYKATRSPCVHAAAREALAQERETK